jgi:hypothetical protein
MFAEVKKLPQRPIVCLNILRGVAPLAEQGLVEASGLYIDKARYGGRYLTWADASIPRHSWRYYLCNYILRHLLEFHFSSGTWPNDTIDLVLDRVPLKEEQRVNTLEYLNSSSRIPLKRDFNIPRIAYLTTADSEYVEALQVVHLFADLVRDAAKSVISPEKSEVSQFLKIAAFLGDSISDWGRKAIHRMTFLPQGLAFVQLKILSYTIFHYILSYFAAMSNAPLMERNSLCSWHRVALIRVSKGTESLGAPAGLTPCGAE